MTTSRMQAFKNRICGHRLCMDWRNLVNRRSHAYAAHSLCPPPCTWEEEANPLPDHHADGSGWSAEPERSVHRTHPGSKDRLGQLGTAQAHRQARPPKSRWRTKLRML